MNARRTPLSLLLFTAAPILSGCQEAPLPSEPDLTGPAFLQVATQPVVNSLLDDGDGTCTDVKCTLRDAIAFADAGGTITFDPTLTAGGPVSIGLTQGQLTIGKNLTIEGPGAGHLAVRRAVATEMRIFEIGSGVTATIAGLTIADGNVSTDPREPIFGGGILNNGTLTLLRSKVSGNAAHEGGGISNEVGATMTLVESTVSLNSATHGAGISNSGTLLVEWSAISGNDAALHGGGLILSEFTAAATIRHSTISGNVAAAGGGVHVLQGSLVLANSTISGNHAIGESLGLGGGILTEVAITVSHSTIADNSSVQTGGGIKSGLETVTLRSSVVARNSASSSPDINSLDINTTYSLVGSTEGNNVTATADNGNIVDVDAADLHLGALDENGGPTMTHALLAGSPALDAGVCTDHVGNTVLDDQRGVARPQGVACDIGAFELEAAESPQDVINEIVARIQAIIDENPGTPTAEELADVVEKLNEAVEKLIMSPPDNQAAVEALEQAVSDLEPAVEDGLVDPGTGEQLMDELAGVARQMAQQAIDAGGDSEKIQEAEQSLAEGDDLRQAKEFTAAIDKYKDALAEAEGA